MKAVRRASVLGSLKECVEPSSTNFILIYSVFLGRTVLVCGDVKSFTAVMSLYPYKNVCKWCTA
jgi:hypothetical protein